MDILKTKKLLDPVLFLVLCALAGTGLALLTGLNESIEDVHPVLGVLFVVLALAHAATSRKWITGVLAGGRISLVLSGLLAGVLVFLVFMFVPLVEEDGRHHGDRHGQAEAHNHSDGHEH